MSRAFTFLFSVGRCSFILLDDFPCRVWALWPKTPTSPCRWSSFLLANADHMVASRNGPILYFKSKEFGLTNVLKGSCIFKSGWKLLSFVNSDCVSLTSLLWCCGILTTLYPRCVHKTRMLFRSVVHGHWLSFGTIAKSYCNCIFKYPSMFFVLFFFSKLSDFNSHKFELKVLWYVFLFIIYIFNWADIFLRIVVGWLNLWCSFTHILCDISFLMVVYVI